jgi:parallel beta-helix repeat protein
MNKNLVIFLMIFITIGLTIGEASAATTGSVKNLNTGKSYNTIQSAVNAASSGNTIVVYSNYTGTENINIPSNESGLTIKSNGSVTVQNSSASSPVFTVNANSVTITGFKIKGGTDGVYLNNVKSCNITGNNITGSSIAGVNVWNSAVASWANDNYYNIINNNQVTNNNGKGIIFNQTAADTLTNNQVNNNAGDGIYFYNSYNVDLTSNTANNNGGNGISMINVGGMASNTGMLDCTCGCEWGDAIEQCTINNNTNNGIFMNNSCGVFVIGSTINTNHQNGIYAANSVQAPDNEGGDSGANLILNYNGLYNTISNNTNYGIKLENDVSTIITDNNFINNHNNVTQAYADHLSAVSASGNYWSDWNGIPPYNFATDSGTAASDSSPSSSQY